VGRFLRCQATAIEVFEGVVHGTALFFALILSQVKGK
jgi:hypothetical protein